MGLMQAIVVRSGSQFGIERVPVPEVGSGEILLEITAAGICAADRKIYIAEHPWDLPDPYFPGHEYVGTVVELGPGAGEASGLKIGDQATAEILIPCHTCWFCRRGLPHHCDRPGVCVGGWADYLKIPAGAIVHRLPDDLEPEAAVLVEPLACSIHAVNLARIDLDDVVVVSGLGAIGMGILQVARLRTPHKLIGLDVDDRLLELASQLGVQHLFNPLRDDVVEEIRSRSEGRGADIYVEASGATASVETGLQALRKAGRLVIFGVYAKKATLDLNIISEFKELEILGGHLSPNTYPLAIKYLYEGLVDSKRMVTHKFALADFEAAIRVKLEGKEASIKTILLPGHSHAA